MIGAGPLEDETMRLDTQTNGQNQQATPQRIEMSANASDGAMAVMLTVLDSLHAEGKPIRMMIERNGVRATLVVKPVAANRPSGPPSEPKDGQRGYFMELANGGRV